ncbi:hypothetical protein N0V88_004959 [Collariella sp. IMI 366227]|nr:hypothetical protein N0V88_004959 [Collariella sp. IMI 366227]
MAPTTEQTGEGGGDNVYPLEDAFSPERVTDHLWLMRKFQSLFAYAESPGSRYLARFPLPPSGVDASKEDEAAQWRVQCFLMSAEVRYSFYLQLLQDWVTKNQPNAAKRNWPLPPWDVALMFYIHMLAPHRYFRDLSVEYPAVWEAQLDFPLARLRGLSHSPYSDEASRIAWEGKFPGVPYQTFEFGKNGENPVLTPWGTLHIQGYKCGSSKCSGKETYTIDAAAWVRFRLGRRQNPACPGCKQAHGNTQNNYSSAFMKFCKAVFGGPVFGLWDAPLRQFGKAGFVERIVNLSGELHLTQAQARYIKFLQLLHAHSTLTFVPTLDIDLVWHTHQLSPIPYRNYCTTHVGRPINHDDTIKASSRSNALDDTKKHWAITYNESFLDPSDTALSARLSPLSLAHRNLSSSLTNQLATFDATTQAPTDLALSQAKAEAEAARLRTKPLEDAWTAATNTISYVQYPSGSQGGQHERRRSSVGMLLNPSKYRAERAEKERVLVELKKREKLAKEAYDQVKVLEHMAIQKRDKAQGDANKVYWERQGLRLRSEGEVKKTEDKVWEVELVVVLEETAAEAEAAVAAAAAVAVEDAEGVVVEGAVVDGLCADDDVSDVRGNHVWCQVF